MTLFFLLLGIALVVAVLTRHKELSASLWSPPPHAKKAGLQQYPSLTVIRPIRGKDPGCRENTDALLNQKYPGRLQILFVMDNDRDEAWPVVADALREYRGPHETEMVTCGSPPPNRAGKLNAMICGYARATGDLVGFIDSDTRPGEDLLRKMVDTLHDHPEAGDVFAPVITTNRPGSFGEAAYGVLVNAWYGPAAAEAAGPSRELPFIMGELMVFRREAIARIGGLQCADGQVVDDMYLGQCVHKTGLKNVMAPWQLPMITEPLKLHSFLELFKKWLLMSKAGLPKEFLKSNWIRGLHIGVSVAALIVALALGSFLGALGPLAAIVAFCWSQLRLQEKFAGVKVPLHLAWAPAAVPLVGGIISLVTLFDRTCDWRGRSYTLDAMSRLNPTAAAQK